MNILIASDKINHIIPISNYITLNYGLSNCKVLIEDNKSNILSMIKQNNINLVILEKYFFDNSLTSLLPLIVICNKNDNNFNNNKNICYINDSKNFDKSLEIIKSFIQTQLHLKSYREYILDKLLYLGFNLKHKGTQHIVEIMLHIKSSMEYFNNRSNLNDEYSYIAQKYNKTIDSVKSNILKSINYMYTETEFSKLKEFFSLAYDCKPTPKQLILTLAEKI